MWAAGCSRCKEWLFFKNGSRPPERRSVPPDCKMCELEGREKWEYDGLAEEIRLAVISLDHHIFPVDGGMGDQPAGWFDKMDIVKEIRGRPRKGCDNA